MPIISEKDNYFIKNYANVPDSSIRSQTIITQFIRS